MPLSHIATLWLQLDALRLGSLLHILGERYLLCCRQESAAKEEEGSEDGHYRLAII